MRIAYPVIFTSTPDGYVSFVPDLDINSQGKDLAEAIAMTRDAIEMWCCYQEDEGNKIPKPSLTKKHRLDDSQSLSFIDVDWLEYRKRNDNRSVKKTLTIPNWLNEKALEKNINFSQTLQEALQERLGL